LKHRAEDYRLYSNNQLNCSLDKSQIQAFGNHLITIVSESLKLSFNLLTV